MTSAHATHTRQQRARSWRQGLVAEKDTVAVVGDGKLGLLIAEVLGRHAVERGGPQVVIIGRHMDKMQLVTKAAAVRPALSNEALLSSDEDGGVDFVRTASFDVAAAWPKWRGPLA